MSAVNKVELAHERDAAWIIALYLAIHGGDPPPPTGTTVGNKLREAAALNAIAGLAQALNPEASQAVQQVLAPLKTQSKMHKVDASVAAERIESLGINIEEQPAEHGHQQTTHVEDAIQRPGRVYCVRFKGVTYCIPLPTPGPHPIA